MNGMAISVAGGALLGGVTVAMGIEASAPATGCSGRSWNYDWRKLLPAHTHGYARKSEGLLRWLTPWPGVANNDRLPSWTKTTTWSVGGISGLASAYLYQQQTEVTKRFYFDNHDDFGGHAKRNEFNADGRTLGFGSGINLEQDYFSDNVHSAARHRCRSGGVRKRRRGLCTDQPAVSLVTFCTPKLAAIILNDSWRQVWLARGNYPDAIRKLGLSASQVETAGVDQRRARSAGRLSLLKKRDYLSTTDRQFLTQRGLDANTIALFEPILRHLDVAQNACR